jgi:3-hydroxyanthranilate 3,4-dioxygenase
MTASTPRAALPSLPINLLGWIAQHRALLKPPVGNKVIWQDQDFICMAVGGPNQRSDFHIDEGPEFFYQIEGQMHLKLQIEGKLQTVSIKAGEIFLLPPRIPHSPQREAGSVGLVIERKRLAHEQDGLAWYCAQCNHALHEEFFVLHDIEQQFKAVFQRFYDSLERRTCSRCLTVHPRP